MAVSQVLQLDGSSDAVELGAAHLLALGPGDFTVEAWVRVDAWGTGAYLPVLGTDEAAPGIGLHLAIRDRRPYMGFYDSDTAGETELALGVWHHLAWRFTAATGEQAMLLNGVLDAKATGKAPYQGHDEVVRIGRYAVDHHFPGCVAELRIWRRALGAGEVLAGMYARLTGGEGGLAGYWPLDDGTGEEAANRYVPTDGSTPPAGRLLGGTWSDDERLPLLAAGESATAPAAGFDGLTSAVTVAAHAALMPPSALTVEAWVRPAATGGEAFEGPVASCGDAVSGWGLRATDRECGFLITLGGRQHRVKWTSTAGPDRWVHLAAVCGGGTLQLHAGGVPVREALETGLAGTLTPYAGDLVIGAHPYWRWRRFRGLIAEVRVWQTARTPAEIQADLYHRLTGDEPGLVGYWPLDDGEGTLTAVDVHWTASDLPPRVAPAVTPAPDSPERLALLEHRLETLQSELAAVEATNQLYELQKDALQARVEEDERTLEERRAAFRAPYDEEIAALEQEAADVRARREALTAAGYDNFVEDLQGDVRGKVEAARAALVERGGTMGLGKVGLHMRFVPSGDGTGALFPAPAEDYEASQVAGVDLALGVTLPPPAVPPPALVPSVLGMTRTLAGRKLKAAGFEPELCFQAVASAAGRVGRVLCQLPLPGSEAVRGATVRLFLGKDAG